MSNQSNGSSQRSMGGSQSVMGAEIVSKREFSTIGNGTNVTELVGPTFREIGPQCVDIVVHGKGYNAINGFSYSVKGQYSYDGESWENFTTTLLIVAAADVNKTRLSTPYTTRTDFGRYIRFLVETDDTANGVAKAQLSISVAFRFQS